MQNLAEGGPLATVGEPNSQHSKKSYVMIMNPNIVVRGCLCQLKMKTPLKTQKSNNLLKTKRILNTKKSTKGVPIFTFSFPWGEVRLLPPSVTPLVAVRFFGEKNDGNLLLHLICV